MAMACGAMTTSSAGVVPSVALLMISSSFSFASASTSIGLPKGYNGLSQSLLPRLLAFSSKSLASKSKLCSLSSPISSTKSGAASKKCVVSALSNIPLVGNLAPDFEAEAVFNQDFIKIKLSDYIGKKYVVVFFYPLDFTFVCPTEITAFSDKYQEFEMLNTEVIGVSTDSVYSHLAWIQTDRKNGGLGELKYPIVSDLTKKISKDYNVLIPDQKKMEPVLGDIPLVGDIPKPVGIALRGLFIIDKEGIIQHATINNMAVGRSVDETLRTLQAVQYVQENPDEVCPAGWKPGEKTLKPDSKLSKEYFATL